MAKSVKNRIFLSSFTQENYLGNNAGDIRFCETANGANDMEVYIDEVRISKDIARWTDNFTVPAGSYKYYSGGNYTSEVIDYGNNVRWDNISWSFEFKL